MKRILAQLKRQNSLSLLKDKISFLVLSIEVNGVWRTIHELVETPLDGKKISFAHDSYVIIRLLPSGNKSSISCALPHLPEILQDLSKMKIPEQVSDVKTILPNILESLSKNNLKAKSNELEITEMKESLEAQVEILASRKNAIEESRQKIQIYANKIRHNRIESEEDTEATRIQRTQLDADRALLNAEVIEFKKNKAILQLKQRQADIEEVQRKASAETMKVAMSESESAKMESDRAALVLAMEHVQLEQERLEDE